MRLHLIAAACLSAAAALMIYAVLAFCSASIASAYTLGAADGTPAGASTATQLGARTYRVVMDPAVPLEAYAARIEAYRAAGMRPQVVVGGTGTSVRGRTAKESQWITAYALAAFKRWPDSYSVSVVNEPDLSGTSACSYAATFRKAFRSLKAAGAPRVLFGEFAPGDPLGWTDAVAKCSKAPLKADGWAWHCYDFRPELVGIGHANQIRRHLDGMRKQIHTPRGYRPPLYCTEYGALTRGGSAVSDQKAAQMWSRALATTRKHMAEIVVWGIHEAPSGAKWDSSIVTAGGTPRPAFSVIAAVAR